MTLTARILLFVVGATAIACASGAAYERRASSGIDRMRLSAWVGFFAVGGVAALACAVFLHP